MKKHLQFIDGTSDKFWQIDVVGSEFTVTYGRNGTSGTSQIKSFDRAAECLKAAEKLLAEKIKKGYSEDGQVNVSAATPSAQRKASDVDAVLEAYDAVIKSQKLARLLPFLIEKSQGHKSALVKHIKKAKRYWMTYVDLKDEPQFKTHNNYSWGRRGTDVQEQIIVLSAIALFDKTDITSWNEVIQVLTKISDPAIFEIIHWAKPNWIDTFLLDKIKKQEWVTISYKVLRLMEQHSLITYNPELWALSLAVYHEYYYHKDQKTIDYINYIVTDTTAYMRDVPELFNYETQLQNQFYRTENSQNYRENSTWAHIYKLLLDEQKLERSFFIRNSLEIQTKEWNANLRLFFRKRLEDLDLKPAELIPYQDIIFTYLHATLPAIVNYGVDLIKQIYEQDGFKTASFIEWAEPLMMRNDCKGAIKTTLTILEKLAKTKPELKSNIALLIADVFIISDMGLQEKAAKSFLKVADANDDAVREKIALYASQLQGTIKNTLSHFIDEDEQAAFDTTQEDYVFKSQVASLLTQEVILPTNWNDIVFQFGTFISSTEVVDTEILVNTFITQRHLFPQDYEVQLHPYVKQLENRYFEGIYKSTVSDFLRAKIKGFKVPVKFPSDHYYSKLKSLFLMRELLKRAEVKIQSDSVLPLLSFPSHAPYWVAPRVLVDRLIAYQEKNEAIDRLDLSIAIARMPRENVAEALPLLDKLEPNMKALMMFCLGLSKEINLGKQSSILTKLFASLSGAEIQDDIIATWAVAAKTYYPEEHFDAFDSVSFNAAPFMIGNFKPSMYIKERWNEWKNYHTKQMERTKSWYELRFEYNKHTSIPSNLLYSLDFNEPLKNDYGYSLYGEDNTYYWHSVKPQYTEPLAYMLLKTACCNQDSGDDSLKAFLNITIRPEFRFSEASSLVLACLFFQEKKTIRLMGAEILINLIEQQKIDVVLLGEKMAYLMSEKYGILSRAIDVFAMIKDVSPMHNSALCMLMDALLGKVNLADKLPTNFKKLIEHYLDLVTKTNYQSSAATIKFLEQWRDNAALKSLINQLLK